MAKTFSPASELDLAESVASSGPFDVRGTGKKTALGRPMAEMPVLSLVKFSGVELYEPEELIFEAGAATPLSEAQKLLASKQQMLAFEPPDFSGILGTKNAGSLGGLLASGFAGPRRIKAGSVRDHVLGVRGVTGKGEIFKAGARVMKNVTGYDVPKLMAGSWGTLAALTSVTFKVLPAPETETTLVINTRDDPLALMSRALQSPCDVSGAAHVPGQGTYLRLEGIGISVKSRRDALVKLLGIKCEVMGASGSRRLWASIRDVTALPAKKDSVIWRTSVPPSDGADFVRRVMVKASGTYVFDWGGGLVWLALDPLQDGGEAAVRGAIKEGHAMLFRASEELRRRVPVFQPQPNALAALSARVKSALDPLAKLNPSRMVEGV